LSEKVYFKGRNDRLYTFAILESGVTGIGPIRNLVDQRSPNLHIFSQIIVDLFLNPNGDIPSRFGMPRRRMKICVGRFRQFWL